MSSFKQTTISARGKKQLTHTTDNTLTSGTPERSSSNSSRRAAVGGATGGRMPAHSSGALVVTFFVVWVLARCVSND